MHCISCGALELDFRFSNTLGTLLSLNILCKACSAAEVWHSQPFIGKMPLGNLLLSAGILFAGASATKTLRVLKHASVASHSYRTFTTHQTNHLFPAVEAVWQQEQTALLSVLADEEKIVVAADGRADSPGHSAKYGTYTMIEANKNKVIDLQLVQVKIFDFKCNKHNAFTPKKQ